LKMQSFGLTPLLTTQTPALHVSTTSVPGHGFAAGAERGVRMVRLIVRVPKPQRTLQLVQPVQKPTRQSADLQNGCGSYTAELTHLEHQVNPSRNVPVTTTPGSGGPPSV